MNNFGILQKFTIYKKWKFFSKALFDGNRLNHITFFFSRIDWNITKKKGKKFKNPKIGFQLLCKGKSNRARISVTKNRHFYFQYWRSIPNCKWQTSKTWSKIFITNTTWKILKSKNCFSKLLCRGKSNSKISRNSTNDKEGKWDTD